ncbi:GntR family transcriptional regulator [Alicyclobacillus ferrooxydans]|uniref:HTH gntR-type domain-containing protein n=1 Tax=Alicyclobacillus ferrooxydans TaxID=471514 RepID=A0A0P9CDV8_9BACL|nr:GntR family transcriptional regulator [Alicyclobacillus ferrooxydans]KPV43969.1 hypothetical protein AN477_09640 [Alicyclobacillus ferrooxydans]
MKGNIPKYTLIKDEIREWITSGHFKPDQQLPTEHQLAEQLSVSRQTIRHAVTELVREGLVYRVQGSGTFVSLVDDANHMMGEGNKLIGVITTYISDYIFPSIIRGIESVLSQHGYSILLFSTGNRFSEEKRALSKMLELQVEGVIVEPTCSALPNPNLGNYFTLLSRNVPVVTLNSTYSELPVPSLRLDDSISGGLAANHLIELGHCRIGGVFKSDDKQGLYRLRGFLKTLIKNRIAPSASLLYMYQTAEKQSVAQTYADMIATMPTSSRPTAIVCYNDEIANSLIRHLKKYNILTPRDVSIVGFDNMQPASEATDWGSLTTINHPKFSMGEKAAEFIIDILKSLRSGGSIIDIPDFVFKSDLLPGESTSSLQL